MKFLITILYCKQGEQTINSFVELLSVKDISAANMTQEIAAELEKCLLSISGDDAGITLISHSLTKI